MPRGGLLLDGAAGGAWNMAVDQALLEGVAPGEILLRFYTWAPATLSLGYFQRLADRASHAASGPCPCVRRPSGGGAILHHHELTYSLAVGADYRPARRHTEVYTLVHTALQEAAAALGVQLEPVSASGSRGARAEPFLCFQRRAAGDLVLGPYKIAGSAQRRFRGALLQHGSVLLARSEFAPELPGIRELSGAGIAISLLQQVWAERLAERLGVGRWEAIELSATQRARAEQLVAATFGAPAWNARR